jgi:ABC-type nickel/cobalt efflux system permease component RcnA
MAGLVAAAVAVTASAAGAHPLGNFTVNHLSRISTTNGGATVRYVLDMAEVPAFALDRSLDAHGTPTRAALAAWAAAHAKEIAPQLQLDVDGRSVALVPVASAIRARPGAGGLPTMYLTATYRAAIGAGAHRLTYRDGTERDRLGWKDVVAGAQTEPTAELTAYPSALLGSPRARVALAANVDAAGRITADDTAIVPNDDDAAGAAAAAPLARSNALSDVLANGAGDPLVVLGALLLAIALGALHALEPGHGKTLLAVSLVGARATPRQAVVLASALTVAHTAGVLALGVVVLAATRWIVPEQIYPWITLASGAFVTLLGARAVAREVRRRVPVAHVHAHVHPHAHPHAHDHVHAPGEHHHPHDHDQLDDAAHARAHAIPGSAPLTFRTAVIAAASGNVAPCPAALVVLLAAISLHRIGYGLALIVAFSAGLALVLTGLGIAVVRGAAWLVARPQFDRVARFAPLVTASVIALVGAVMVGQGFAAQGVGVSAPVVTALVLLAVAAYAVTWHQHRAPAEARA